MRNIDEMYEAVSITTTTPTIRETITIGSRSRTYLSAIEWGWRELRDYVIDQSRMRFGDDVCQRDPVKEASIFRAFIKRWGPQRAEAIARYIFETCEGVWLNEPITPVRFTKGADPFFAIPIADRLGVND